MELRNKILNMIDRKLSNEGKMWDEGTTVRLKINEEEREEFLNNDTNDEVFSHWEIEEIETGLYELVVSV